MKNNENFTVFVETLCLLSQKVRALKDAEAESSKKERQVGALSLSSLFFMEKNEALLSKHHVSASDDQNTADTTQE